MVGAFLARQADVDGVRLCIRATARTSLLFFLMAYTAQSVFVLWPGDWSMWLRRHRRQWGLLLVVSHTIHAVGIVSLAMMAPALFQTLAPLGNRITGGIAYVLLWAMGVTSFGRTAAWLGRPWWRRLHTVGIHYLWLSFLVANGKRIAHAPVYAWPTLLLLLALGLRIWASRRQAQQGAGAQ
jgi:DMSO/TMAO reductase YedYZ heme-binding membrane subunit